MALMGPRRRQNKSVYLLYSEKLGFYKIGRTDRDVPVRVRELEKELNAGWEIIAYLHTDDPVKLEGLFHHAFAHRKVPSKTRREWFDLTPAEEQLFIRLAEDIGRAREKRDREGIKENRAKTGAAEWWENHWPHLLKYMKENMKEKRESGLTAFFLAQGRPQYSLSRHTLRLWFDGTTAIYAAELSEPWQMQNLREALHDVFVTEPEIKIVVEYDNGYTIYDSTEELDRARKKKLAGEFPFVNPG